jgi:hypothetical protein
MLTGKGFKNQKQDEDALTFGLERFWSNRKTRKTDRKIISDFCWVQ